MTSVEAQCRQRVKRLSSRIATLERRRERITWLRLLSFALTAILSVAGFLQFGAPGLFLPLAVLGSAFIYFVRLHQTVELALRQVEIWRRHTQAQIARLRVDWTGIPPPVIMPGSGHPFEVDLDLTGERSLHQLIDTAISPEGSRRLRNWLLNQTPIRDEILRRQAIVRELRDHSLLRDKLIVRGLSATRHTGQWDGTALRAWLDAPDTGRSLRGILILLSVLSVVNAAGFVASLFVPLLPALVLLRAASFAIYALVSIAQVRRSLGLFERVTGLNDAFAQMDAVFGLLERYPYRNAPHVRQLCAPLLDPQRRPSDFLRRIRRLVTMAGLQNSQVIWLVINAALPWDLFVAYRLDVERARLVGLLPGWLDCWTDLEACNSLANHASLNPAFTFPELVGAESPITFEARGLGHPLIPPERKVVNDFASHQPGEITIVTGSNMSGKSAFLRTVGINIGLALTGGAVNAASLRCSMFRVFACIRVSDSLTEGFSYFYAEVRRLKQIMTALNQQNDLPLLFLIDEIFKGTNNRERLIGSRAYIRAVVGKHGIGLVSTHDLELVQLADELSLIRNAHFADAVHDGQMTFDYRLREGGCPTTNALRIMAIEGLPVEDTTITASDRR